MEPQPLEVKKISLFKRFWWVGWLVVFVIVAVAVASAVIFWTKRKPDTGDDHMSDLFENGQTEDTGQPAQDENCPPAFTYEFTDFSKIDDFQPIGSISGASRGRSYITVKIGETVPVYTPVDATLISVIYAFRGTDADHGEYGFKFDAGCGVTFLLDHLDTISDEMRQYAPAEPSTSTASSDNLSIPIAGGTMLGSTNGTPQARTFDFLVLDEHADYFYVNRDRWVWEQSLYSVCPYDFFETEIKDRYYEKIGLKTDTGFTQAESCGSPSYDIADTISGGWFLDEDATDLSGQFLLIGERMGAIDLTVKTDSEGTIMRITDYDPEILPEDVGIGESVCYEGFSNDWVYVHLIDGQTVEINDGSGDCPSSFPTAGATRYYR